MEVVRMGLGGAGFRKIARLLAPIGFATHLVQYASPVPTLFTARVEIIDHQYYFSWHPTLDPLAPFPGGYEVDPD